MYKALWDSGPCAAALLAGLPVRVTTEPLLFPFERPTQFIPVRVLDCDLQKRSGNLKPKREHVGRVPGTPRAKRGLETLRTQQGCEARITGRHQLTDVLRGGDLRPAGRPRVTATDESDWLN